MENASKALLIAGAILLVILIIAVGMYVFGIADDWTKTSTNKITSLAVNTFNSEFEDFEGPSVKGSSVKDLISKVNSSNSTYADEGITISIVLDSATATSTVKGLRNKIKDSARYTVEITEYTTEGYVEEITITTN